MDPITGRRADQMNGQEGADSGSPGSPGRNGRNGRNGTSVDSSRLPFWATGDPGRAERREVPADFGRSQRAGVSREDRAGVPADGGRSAATTPPEPDPPPGHEIRHLAREPRLPVWRRRLLIAALVGVLLTIFIDWRIGLTGAVIAAIADAFIRSRSSAASSAEGLTSSAQRRTKRELAKLERAGYRALHMRAIPGSDEVIDHLLIGPTGVYAIDSEQWDKRLPVRTRNARQLWHGPYSQKDRLEHARWEAAQASDLVGHALGEEIGVRPAMVVYGPSIPWGVATIRDVDVFGADRLRKYLRRPRGGGPGSRLTPAEVERIYTAAAKVLPAKG